MNIVWNLVFLIGSFVLIVTNPSESLNSLFNAGNKSVELCIELLGLYAVWLGLLQIIEDSGLNKKLAIWLKPVIKFLFGNIDEKANEQIAINISANLFGMGNASTPSGIKAMELLDNKNGKITEPMTMLMVINCLSLQIMPTTIIGMRILAGSTEASSVILPIILTSIISMAFSIFCVKIAYAIKKRGKK